MFVFLDRHRLAHTLEDIAFAHEYLHGHDEGLRSGANDAMDGGSKWRRSGSSRFVRDGALDRSRLRWTTLPYA